MPYRTAPKEKPKLPFLCRHGWHKVHEMDDANPKELRRGFFPDHMFRCLRCNQVGRMASPVINAFDQECIVWGEGNLGTNEPWENEYRRELAAKRKSK